MPLSKNLRRGSRKTLACAVAAPVLLGFGMVARGQSFSEVQQTSPWFEQGTLAVSAGASYAVGDRAKNVILFVGDGMGITTLTSARIHEGQKSGGSGEEGLLFFETFPSTALVKTYSVDAQTADSAATMTAMMSGVKTNTGLLGASEVAQRGDCSSVAGQELITLIELAELNYLATGVVTNTRVTDATPAATYAKSADWRWENDTLMPASASSLGCKDTAVQLIESERQLEARIPGADIDGIDVILGGGKANFLPNQTDGQSDGARSDGRNLIDEWLDLYPSAVYVDAKQSLSQLPAGATKVLGLFSDQNMQYRMNRLNAGPNEPSLSEMTVQAINVLSNNTNGFLLIVEAGRIDDGHHAGSAHAALDETIELAQAAEAAFDATNANETLILVTADHSHALSVGGSFSRGNSILGTTVFTGFNQSSIAEDGLPYTVLTYLNGRGYADLGAETNPDVIFEQPVNAGRKLAIGVDTTATGFHQEALIPLEAATHAGEDVTIHAIGPGSEKVRGVLEQNAIFNIIDRALGLLPD